MEQPMVGIPYVEPGQLLFRYLSPQSPHFWNAITDILYEKKIFLSSRSSFNDPYDSSPEIHDDLSSSAIRRYAREMMQYPLHPLRDPGHAMRILKLKAEGKTRLSALHIANIKAEMVRNTAEYLDECGLASFSLVSDHPLLWSHYAAGSSGICVVFRRGPSMQSAFCVCAQVSYVEKRPQLPTSLFYRMVRAQRAGEPFGDLADEIFSLSYLHKSAEWSYEKEARIYYPFSASKKIPFDQNELVGIILGPKSTRELEKQLKRKIDESLNPIRLHRATLSESGFKIVVPTDFAILQTSAA
jgi:hypothetical protein